MAFDTIVLVLLTGRVVGRFESRAKAQEFIALIDPMCQRDIEVLEVRKC
jgi:hypothetical protein